MRAYVPEGLPLRGALQGVITDTNGWPLPRTTVMLTDAKGEVLANYETKKDGKYELPLDNPCQNCRIKAERAGFDSQQRNVDYNGTNSLWFSFALVQKK